MFFIREEGGRRALNFYIFYCSFSAQVSLKQIEEQKQYGSRGSGDIALGKFLKIEML